MLVKMLRGAGLALALGMLSAPAMAATVVDTLPSGNWSTTALVGGGVTIGDEGAVLKTGANGLGRAELRLGSAFGDRMGTVTSAIANNTKFSFTTKSATAYIPELMIAIGVSDFATLRYAFDPAHATTIGEWTTWTVDIATAKFWSPTAANRLDITAGLSEARTLADWAAEINRNAGNATLNQQNNDRFKNATINSLALSIFQQPNEEAVIGAFSMTGSGTAHDFDVTFGGYVAPVAVPVPAALPLLAAGLGGLVAAKRLRRKA